MDIEGQSVRLRSSTDGDVPRLREILSDPKTMEHLKGLAHLPDGWTDEAMRARLARLKSAEKTGHCLDFVIACASTGVVMGQCGFPRISPEQRNAEFGIILHHDFWGGPAATECHLACLDHGFSALRLHRVEFVTSVANERMCAFFDRCAIPRESVRRDAFLDGDTFVDAVSFSLLEDEWPETKALLERRLKEKQLSGLDSVQPELEAP